MASHDEDRAVSEDALAEDESRYLRRPKAIPVRRGNRGRSFRYATVWGAVVAVILAPLFFGLFLLARYALNSPRFELTGPEEVTVVGNRYVSTQEVLDQLNLEGIGPADRNLFRMPLGTLREQLKAVPWIQSATLLRAFPHRLAIFIKERTPVAYAQVGSRIELVDSAGVLLEPPGKAKFDFPILLGLNENQTPEDRKDRLQLYLTFAQTSAQALASAGWTISEVDVSDAGDLKALLVKQEQTVMVHFGRQDFGTRVQNLLRLFPQWQQEHVKVDSVDLRYPNEVVVNPENSGGDQASSQP